MSDKQFPHPWQHLVIPESFCQVIEVVHAHKQFFGRFAMHFEYSTEPSINKKINWPRISDEYALYLETSEEYDGTWAYLSNRYHYFLPNHSAEFHDDIFTVNCMEKDGRFKQLSFRPLTTDEWRFFLDEKIPESMQERVDLIVKKYWTEG